MDNPIRIETLEKVLDRQIAWIESANTRTATAITLATAMLGVLAALSPAKGLPWTWLQCLFVGLSVLSLLLCLLMCVLAVFPRTKGPEDSMIFFGPIARRDRKDFIAAAKTLTAEEYSLDLAAQVHINAQIAKTKFRWVHWAMRAFFVSILPWVVAVYFFYQG